jgi:hypothetical protein
MGDGYTLDTSELGDAPLLDDYAGRISVRDFAGEQTYELVGGQLPPGLALDSDGFVTGTATWLGSFEFDVRVTGEALGTLEEAVMVTVHPGIVNVQLGWLRDQTTRLTDAGNLMWDPWTRVAGAGEDQTQVTLLFGLYAEGQDGFNRHGRGDDVLVGEVDPGQVEITLGPWTPVDDAGDPIAYIGDATFEAGEATGESTLTLELEGYAPVQTRVMVTAPDWCPQGDHPGGPLTEGFCA